MSITVPVPVPEPEVFRTSTVVIQELSDDEPHSQPRASSTADVPHAHSAVDGTAAADDGWCAVPYDGDDDYSFEACVARLKQMGVDRVDAQNNKDGDDDAQELREC
eukprot:TRINITY_DN18490_c0_g1_i2.p3 TRINITY_DN18490_c0_g1~~TRINITY_DN18490_c0_g1_i2.p3  ORF type:complete len:106 (-),score=32.90 TRINITY_DN18490_c0_g1_i2:4-321(-)